MKGRLKNTIGEICDTGGGKIKTGHCGSQLHQSDYQDTGIPVEKGMQALRNLSTRARITPTSFVNKYNWGDFTGNPLKLVERYFDAFLKEKAFDKKRKKIRENHRRKSTFLSRLKKVGLNG